MRRSLILTVAAAVAMVLLAMLVPMAILMRDYALEDRLATAALEVQATETVVSGAGDDNGDVSVYLDRINADSETLTTVLYPGTRQDVGPQPGEDERVIQCPPDRAGACRRRRRRRPDPGPGLARRQLRQPGGHPGDQGLRARAEPDLGADHARLPRPRRPRPRPAARRAVHRRPGRALVRATDRAARDLRPDPRRPAHSPTRSLRTARGPRPRGDPPAPGRSDRAPARPRT